MSNKKNKPNKSGAVAVKPDNTQRLSRPALISIIIAAILAAALIIWAVVMAVSSALDRSRGRIDYINDDLTKYLVLNEADYKNYDIEIDIPEVTDMEVENEILKTLAANKGELLYDGGYLRSEPICAGDKAYIWYRGYELDENGRQIDLEGTTNFLASSATELVIGSGSFICGFELGLVGAVPNQHGRFSAIKTGKPTAENVVYLTLSYIKESEDKIHTDESVRIDLKDPQLEDKWGVGIKDYICDMMMGTEYENPFGTEALTAGGGEKITYLSAKISCVTNCEINPLVVKTVFPYDYSEESFRNKTVYFDVYIEKALHYEAQALDEAFIKDKLAITEEKLEGYSGENLVEKYRSYVKSTLVSEREADIRYAAEDKMWEYLKENITIKKLPDAEVRRIYDDYYYNYQMAYAEQYSSYYESVDEYIVAQMGLSTEDDWREALTAMVEDEVREKLIFFSFMKAEGLVPTEEEYLVLYNNELERDFEYYGKTRDDFNTEEEYLSALRDYEELILANYGEEFYRESVYYNYASGKMLALANVKNSATESE